MSRIADTHDELYHYTTAAGLSGILESKSLWATHASFVNDEEEILGFYDRVLPEILRPVLRKHVEVIKDQPEFFKLQENTPFDVYFEEQFAKWIRTIKVELCVREENGIRQHLPIKRIIIGPHRDKNDRKRAVQMLLKQHGLTAHVSVSDIPYRGR